MPRIHAMSDRCLRCDKEIEFLDNNFHNVTPGWPQATYVHLQCDYLDLLNHIDALKKKLRLAEEICHATIALRDFRHVQADAEAGSFYTTLDRRDKALTSWEAQQPNVNDFED